MTTPLPRPLVRTTLLMAALFVGGLGSLETSAQPSLAATGLTYDTFTQGPVPIPPAERGLQTAKATPWFKVSADNRVLEGAIFDAHGTMLVCDVTGRRVLRLTPDKQLSTVVTLKDFAPGGLAFHPDGRLFIAALNLERGQGTIVALPAASSETRAKTGADAETIIPSQFGYLPNDLAFDATGGFYFTDFKGTATTMSGGVYYVSPDFTTITPVLSGLVQANGLALSPEGTTLWVTEFGRNLLHRVELANATALATIGSAVPYHFTGPAPDSMRMDADGNVYVALYGQGRVMVFNKNGIPLGQIVLPGREQGKNLLSTSLAIRPGGKELYVVSGNAVGAEGATIFTTQAFSKGLPPSSSR